LVKTCIPNELWTKILGYIEDPRDFLRIRRTSTCFQAIVSQIYFGKIFRLRIVSHTNQDLFTFTTENTIWKRHPLYYMGREAYILNLLHFFWKQAPNLTECLLDGFMLHDMERICPQSAMVAPGPLKLLTEIQKVGSQQPREIEYLRCVFNAPELVTPADSLLNQENIWSTQALHHLIQLWQSSLTKIEIRADPQYWEGWIQIIKKTFVTHFMIHLPRKANHGTENELFQHPIQRDTEQQVLSSLRQVFHRPDRVVRQISIYAATKEQDWLTPSGVDALQSLITLLPPVDEFTLKLSPGINEQWVVRTNEVKGTSLPETSFRTQLKILHLDPQMGIDNTTQIYRCCRVMFPNLSKLTGLSFSLEIIPYLIRDVLTTREQENVGTLTILGSPIQTTDTAFDFLVQLNQKLELNTGGHQIHYILIPQIKQLSQKVPSRLMDPIDRVIILQISEYAKKELRLLLTIPIIALKQKWDLRQPIASIYHKTHLIPPTEL
jgi:hypothetical protein